MLIHMHVHDSTHTLIHMFILSFTVSAEVIDEVEALRQRDIEKAAYQPELVIGWEIILIYMYILYMYKGIVQLCMHL